jgi:hypothetical protein
MTKNNCEMIRRQLDELMLDEACSSAALEHLHECSACREFYQTQTKLRRMVGSIGTVAAPPDFDFRLRARLANDSSGATVHYWSFARRGLAFAALAFVFVSAVVVVRNVLKQPTTKPAIAETTVPVTHESPAPVPATQSNSAGSSQEFSAGVAGSNPQKVKIDRSLQAGPRRRQALSVLEPASQGAPVISGSGVVGTEATAVIPIDASLQSLKVSLDDGRGNAKTISVPAIRFGSQRMLPNRYQLAQEGIW